MPHWLHSMIVAGACPLWDDLPRSAIVAVRQPSRGAGFADVAQLVAHHLAKVRVAGSNPVVRSEGLTWSHLGGLLRWSGREARQRPAKPSTRVQIPSPPRSTNGSTQALPALPLLSSTVTQFHRCSARQRAIGAVWLARFPDTEEVTGSSPVSPTTVFPGQRKFPDRHLRSVPNASPMGARFQLKPHSG